MTYEVIVGAANPEHKLIPGMTANLTIYTLELNDVTAVPLKALKFQPTPAGEDDKLPQPKPLSEPGKHTLWVVRGNDLVQTDVELGVSNSVYQQIKTGLKPGDKVALQYHLQMMQPQKEGQGEENPFMPKPPGANRKR